MLSELAAGSRCAGRIFGSSEFLVGWLTAKKACCTEKRHSSAHTLVFPSADWSQKSALVTISPVVETIRIVRRSKWSASAPP